ncbi:MAG: serine hydrolase domain-containing protein [Nocardioides sp.]
MDLSGLDEVLLDQAFSGVIEIRRLATGSRGEPLFLGAYGLASPRWGVANTVDTRFDVASISKLFTSVAVLRLVEQGRLDLDRSIHAYADLAGTQISPEVTLRHLLTHTSGIADIAEEDDGENYAEVFAVHPPHMVNNATEFLPIFADKPPNFAPGDRYRYCNAGFILAGLAVESTSGSGFQEFVEREIFARVGMSRSAYFDKRYVVPDLAEGCDPDDQGRLEQNIYAYPPRGQADGGAFCTASDLLAFLDGVRGGMLLSPELTETFFTPQVDIDAADDYRQGFGLVFRRGKLWKEGGSEGASGILMHYTAEGVDLAVLCNNAEGAWPAITEVSRLVCET